MPVQRPDDRHGVVPSRVQPPGPWTPFHQVIFTVLWTATLVSNVGIWMYNSASGWLMTSLAWLEHLRQHERATHADRALQDALIQFQAVGSPKVSHFIAADPKNRESE